MFVAYFMFCVAFSYIIVINCVFVFNLNYTIWSNMVVFMCIIYLRVVVLFYLMTTAAAASSRNVAYINKASVMAW